MLFVTGASSDLGITLLKEIASNYDIVYAHYCHSKETLEKLQTTLPDTTIIPVQADFGSEEATVALADRFGSEYQTPDHFVHLAACKLNNIPFRKTTWQMYQNEWDTSFRSAVTLSQKIVPQMAKRKSGKVVFMLSSNVLNRPPVKYSIPYTTTKYALLGFMRVLAAEYAEKGITINGVSPSMIETKFLSNVPDMIVQKNAMESPLKRNLHPEDVTPAIRFLLSEGANCITGENLAVTAGN